MKVAPIEIYVQISATKVPNKEELFGKIQTQLSDWKKTNNFPHPINLTLMPMDWKFEVDI